MPDEAENDSGDWLSVSEAAELLGCDGSTIRRHCDSNKLTSYRTIGDQRRILRASVLAYLPPETAA